MNLPLLAVGLLGLLAIAYRFYGRFVAAQYGLDDAITTPAVGKEDGVDFVPTQPFYLLGQHFSAIAAAGPIAGPILACQAFGWLPCLLWIGLGVVLIGAVHDFTSLAASVRHGATSVAEITREHLGAKAGRAMMAFIWIALIYVIVAFADITAGTFVAGSEELRAAGGGYRREVLAEEVEGARRHEVHAVVDLVRGGRARVVQMELPRDPAAVEPVGGDERDEEAERHQCQGQGVRLRSPRAARAQGGLSLQSLFDIEQVPPGRDAGLALKRGDYKHEAARAEIFYRARAANRC